jgi:hypothetical protein
VTLLCFCLLSIASVAFRLRRFWCETGAVRCLLDRECCDALMAPVRSDPDVIVTRFAARVRGCALIN